MKTVLDDMGILFVSDEAQAVIHEALTAAEDHVFGGSPVLSGVAGR